MSALDWSESMSGRVSFDTTDYNQGWWQGTPCAFHLDLHVDDVERFFADDEHEATCTGWIDCDGLGERMEIAEGAFNLLVAAGGSRRREMRYRLFAHDRAGRPVTLAGFKEVEDGWFRDTWVDTTTLFTRLYHGRVTRDEEDGATALATGVLHVSAGGFLALMLSMRGSAARQAALRLVLRALAAAGLRRAQRRHGARPTSPGCTPARSAGRASHPRNGTTAPGGRACAGASWPCAPRTTTTSPSTTSAARPSRPRGPVLLQHGTGVRANLFYGSPMAHSIVDVLVDGGL